LILHSHMSKGTMTKADTRRTMRDICSSQILPNRIIRDCAEIYAEPIREFFGGVKDTQCEYHIEKNITKCVGKFFSSNDEKDERRALGMMYMNQLILCYQSMDYDGYITTSNVEGFQRVLKNSTQTVQRIFYGARNYINIAEFRKLQKKRLKLRVSTKS
ncbi:MAG: hypothetical protein AB1779_07520, partial [Candidatus Thermoplasmatota archaeon]